VRTLNLQLPKSDRPAYHRIADAVRDSLRSGALEKGSLIPSTRELGKQLGFHRHTITRALEELVAEGWLEVEPGRGYRVATNLPKELNQQAADWPDFPVLQGIGAELSDSYAFPSGKPDLRIFPKDEFFKILRKNLRQADPEELLGYSDPAGSRTFRKQLQTYLARMRGLSRGQLMVTHGSQEAIFLLGQLFGKGERRTVCVERMGYPPAWDALRLSGLELVGLDVDEQGVDVDALERRAQHDPPALLYLTPLHQYPTTATLSIERRRKLLRVVQQHQIPVIEDDYDHEFHYFGRPVLPLAGEDESGLVVYVSTFSKLVYPSARLGFCLIPEALLEPLCRLKRSTTRQNDLLLQETMASWMKSGGLDRHLRRMRKVYSERLEHLSDGLRRLGIQHLKPRGGMSVWCDLGPGSKDVLKRAAELGLYLRSAHYYQLDGTACDHLRLGFASMTCKEIDKGLDILGKALC
jgi:GntR family transcriptional regulator / MocR family aminotransferase